MVHTPDDPTKAQVWITKGLDDLDFEFYFPQGPKGDPGGFAAATHLQQNDLNTIRTPGLYRQTIPADATMLKNYPKEALAGSLRVYERATDFCWQEYEGLSAGQEARVIYRRAYIGNWWTPWRAQVTQRIDQTAGRAIYTWDDINLREQLIYGDTGWRNVSSDSAWINAFSNGADLTISNNLLMVRRIGYLVNVVWGVSKPTAGTINTLAAVPTGFRSEQVYNAVGVNSSVAFLRAYIGGSTSTIAVQGTQTGGAYTFNTSWMTSDAWPTVLPGISGNNPPIT
jgi:hypothetical protein